MPQIDLPQLFSASAPPKPAPQPVPIVQNPVTPTQQPLLQRLRLSGPQLANLGFVICACLGALFSAAYLYKGGELLQEVAAWPRELFYARPARLATNQNNGGNVNTAVIPPVPEPDNSGDPFSPVDKLLNLYPASGRWPNGPVSSAPFSSSSSALTQLPVRSAAGASTLDAPLASSASPQDSVPNPQQAVASTTPVPVTTEVNNINARVNKTAAGVSSAASTSVRTSFKRSNVAGGQTIKSGPKIRTKGRTATPSNSIPSAQLQVQPSSSKTAVPANIAPAAAPLRSISPPVQTIPGVTGGLSNPPGQSLGRIGGR